MPPLFKIQHKEKIFYAYDENEKDKIIKKEFSNKGQPTLSRYKGLGEMPADQLKSTTMHPEKRKLLNIKINQGKKELKETENLFESLMGKKAEHRYKFIQENANFTEQIDI
jgi:topoisomerase-4 subunit B